MLFTNYVTCFDHVNQLAYSSQIPRLFLIEVLVAMVRLADKRRHDDAEG